MLGAWKNGVSLWGWLKKKHAECNRTILTIPWNESFRIDKNMHVGRLYLLDDCMKCYMWQSICIPIYIYIHTNIHSYIHIDWRFLVLPFPNILWCTSRQFSSLVQDRPVVGPMPFWLVLAGNDPQISLLDVFAHIWDSDKAFMFFFSPVGINWAEFAVLHFDCHLHQIGAYRMNATTSRITRTDALQRCVWLLFWWSKPIVVASQTIVRRDCWFMINTILNMSDSVPKVAHVDSCNTTTRKSFSTLMYSRITICTAIRYHTNPYGSM